MISQLKHLLSRINNRIEGSSWVQKMKRSAEERRLKRALASLSSPPPREDDGFSPDRTPNRYIGTGA